MPAAVRASLALHLRQMGFPLRQVSKALRRHDSGGDIVGILRMKDREQGYLFKMIQEGWERRDSMWVSSYYIVVFSF